MKNVEDVYPLSPTQEGILFQSLYAEKPDIYFRQLTCSLQGNLQVSAFRQAWQQVLDRHSILRTAFVWEGLDNPLQIVRRRVTLPWQQLDWRSISSAEQQERQAAFLYADHERGFELSQAPLMRLALAQLADERYHLIWSDHHLLLDGWSKSLLFKELLLCYEALSCGRQISLSPARPFRDYIAWLKRQDMSEGEAFWRARLKGFSAPTPLGVEGTAKGRVKEKRYDTQYLHLTTDATATVQRFARRHSLTLNTVVQAAWAILLSRYSGEEDVVFGTVVNGRPAELDGAERLVGIFINILPVRALVSLQSLLRPWLKEMQDRQVESRRYEFISLAQIHGWSEVSRSTPLFQSIVIFQNYPLDASLMEKRDGLEIHNFNFVESTDFPLTLEAGVLASQLFLKIIYDCALLDLTVVNRMMLHLKTLIESMCAGAQQQQLSDLQLLSEAERRQLLVEWNATAAEFPQHVCFHQLFEAQVARTPEAVALVCKEDRLTYTLLDRRANRLAQHLVEQGVEPEAIVAVLAERSSLWVTALLGIFKAGGVYLPLDPLHPSQRLVQVLEQSGAGLVLVTENLRASLTAALALMPEESHPRVVSIEELLRRKSAEEPPGARSQPSNLAYVIYTSGSTGRPKGAMIEHTGMLNHLYVKVDELRLTRRDVVAQTASQCFDISVWQLLAPLLVGASVLIIEDDSAHDPSALMSEIEREAVTILETVPSLLQAMLEQALKVETDLRPQFSSMRWMLVTGEALPAELCRQWFNLYPQTPLLNAYGPTECSDDVTHQVIERSPAQEAMQVPIGRPVANIEMYVLDRGHAPVPVGVAGELYVGGIGVGRGYLLDPGRTAEAFVPDPYGGRSGARLYKTGDAGRYLSDGAIEFLGRLDHQVKVRGFRIELGEVEAVLTAHAAVRAAVVVAHQPDGGKEKRLIAYVVTDQGDGPTNGNLREHVAQHLPEYMIPSAFVRLAELPLSPNGKVDRRALPAPDQLPAGADAYLAPRTPIEELIAGIWAEVLKLERVGVEEDFFELGGHSLLATQVISRVRSVFEVELPVRSIFEHPTVARLAERIVCGMSEAPRVVMPAMIAVARDGKQPLSFAQQRLWFLDQLEPASTAYNMPAALRLKGELDVGALERALSEIIRRHEVLRTTFRMSNGRPVQVIAGAGPVSLVPIDLSQLREEEREHEARRLSVEEAEQPFDLSSGPLLRVSLLRLAEDEHVLNATMHHIVSDGWSLGLLVHELAALYAAFSAGEASPLPELQIQYADYAHWQREWLQGEVLEEQLRYWREQLADAPPLLELPTDRPRPPVQTFRGSQQSQSFSHTLSEKIEALSRREGVTLFMTLLAAFQALLSRYSGQEDIVIGTPIAGRNRVEVEQLIGFFVNTLVLRTKVSAALSFSELLRRVREVALGAYTHQDVPFEMLVEELQPVRSLSYSPLFQVMFVLQNVARVELELLGVNLQVLAAEGRTAKFDLTLFVMETAGELVVSIEHNTDLFEKETIKRMLGHFERLLSAAVADPQQKVSELALLSDEERHQLLVEWNQTHAQYPHHLCTHQLFEAQVSETPERIALVFEQEQLSYRELNAHANQLAHYLQALGVGPEAIVALSLDRSPLFILAILAVWKAGAAYLPLETAQPSERLRSMFDDTRPAVVLTHQGLRHLLPSLSAHVVSLDTDWEQVAAHSCENPPGRAVSQNLAYVIFTSGSTGRPKGVAVEHRQLVNYVKGISERLELRSGASYASVSTFAADLGHTMIFPALCLGGCLHVVSQERATDPEAMADYLSRHKIDYLKIVPAHLNALLSCTEPARIVPRRLVLGGEATGWELIERLHEIAPGCEIDNHYGPTETTVGVTTYRVEAGRKKPRTSVPLGRPLANTEIYLLDGDGRLVATGLRGELHIGGAGVGRGYINQPEQTAQRFVPDAWSGRSGARVYKSGDVGRYWPDGQIEFLGRVDNQVKVRGYRIEVGEIEAMLCEHETVREAVVAALEDRVGEKRLVAYVVGAAGEEVSDSELRAHLSARVPEYMIPSAFVRLAELPLSPNGKVDRRALPAPDQLPAGDKAYLAPRTPIEELIAGIWAEVLKLERVGVEEDFFELGGHSLLATQVISRLRSVFEVELPVRSIFEHSTVERLAQRIVTAMPEGQSASAPPIVAIARDEELPLSFAQQRLWFLNQLEPGNPFYNVGAAIRLTGVLDASALADALNEIIRRHEGLRTTFDSVEGQPRQVIASSGELKLAVVNLSERTEEAREREMLRLARAEAQRPFDLSTGPLLRACLLRLGEHEHVLLFTLHHIISDGWSVGVLVKEVSALYQAFSEGRPSPLPELPLQYADFAVWQREWLSSERIETQVAYWRKHLLGAPPVLKLRTGKARPAVQSFHGASATVTVERDVSRALKELSREVGATLFMTLLAAWQVLLWHHSGQEEIVTGTPIANRNRREIEELIGFFVNTLVLRTSVRGEMSFRELLGHVREVTLGAHAHQDVPFEMLVEHLQPVRSLGHSPLFQVWFVFQNMQPVRELKGLTWAPLEIERTTVRHDLNLDLRESAEGLSGFMEYRTELFDEATIKGWVRQLLMILEEVSARPDVTLDALSGMLAEVDRQLQAGREKDFREASRRKLQDKRRKVISL